MDYVSDSEASSDEDDGTDLLLVGNISFALISSFSVFLGSIRRKGRPYIHAESIQSTVLPPDHCMMPEECDNNPKFSMCNGDSNKHQKNVVVAKPVVEVIRMDMKPNTPRDPSPTATKLGKFVLDRKADLHNHLQDCCSSESIDRLNHPRVTEEMNAWAPAGKEQSTNMTQSISGEMNISHSLISNHAAAGLAYIGSQEPGELSQANAMDVVDKLLSDYNAGLSLDIDTERTQGTSSFHVLVTRGAHCLAKRADRIWSVRRAGIFDWDDSLEDERQDGFLSNRNDYFCKKQASVCESPSVSLKPIHLNSKIIGGAHDMSGQKECRNCKHSNGTSLMCPDPCLVPENPVSSKKLHVPEAKKKNIFKDVDEWSNSKSLEQQLEAVDVVECIEDVYDVGPNTQMAAEAMEALFCGSPVNHELEDASPVGGMLTTDCSRGMIVEKASAMNLSLQKIVSSSLNSESIQMQRKGTKARRTMSNRRNLSSRKCSSKSRMNRKSEDTIEKTQVINQNWDMKEQSYAIASANPNEHFESFKQQKASERVNGTFVNEVEKYCTSWTSKGKHSDSKQLIIGEHSSSDKSVLHQTKQSETKATNDASFPEAQMKENMHFVDASGLLRPTNKNHTEVSGRSTTFERKFGSHPDVLDKKGKCKEKLIISAPKRDALSYRKRRTTHLITSSNSDDNDTLNNQLLTIDVKTTAKVQPTKRGRIKDVVRSLPEILDTAKRRRRTAVTPLLSQSGQIPSNPTKLSSMSCLQKRASVSFAASKPDLGKDSKKCSTNNFSTAVMKHRGPLKEVAVCKLSTESASNFKHVEGRSLYIQQSDVARKTPLKETNTGVPFCMAYDPMRRPCNKGLSKSSARELIRLEAAEPASACLLKDSRKRKDMASVRVLFSQNLDEDIIKQQKKILMRFRIPVAPSISDATHFITDKFARTRNMLEAMAMGKPVVTNTWLESCGQASCYIDEKNYILRDLKKEREIGFSMPVSLNHARHCPLLQGMSVLITPKVKPDQALIASLVKAAHGQKASERVNGTFVNEVEKYCTSWTSKGKHSDSKQLIIGEHSSSDKSVLHQTKQSETKATNDASFPEAQMKENMHFVDASGLLRPTNKNHTEVSGRSTTFERKFGSHPDVLDKKGKCKEKLIISAPKRDALSYRKRRTTHLITSSNSDDNDTLNNQLLTIDVKTTAKVQPTKRGRIKDVVRSLPEILDTAKRRKRTAVTRLLSQSGQIPSNPTKLSSMSCLQKRASVSFAASKPDLGKDSKKCSTNNFSTAVMKHRGPLKEVAVCKLSTESASNFKHVEGRSLYIQQSDVARKTPLKETNTGVPFCMAYDPMRRPCNKGLSKSSARELIRLEAAEPASACLLKDSRKRKDMASVRVLFSQNLDEDIIKQQKKILMRFRIPVAPSISDATHFITDKFARTRNMLEAMAMGKPVVTNTWLESCGQASCYIDEKNYILRDLKKEREIGFSMPVSLNHARHCPLLQGMSVLITPKVKPDQALIASLVKAAHGQPLEQTESHEIKENKVPDDLIIISCEEDYEICFPFLEQGGDVFSSELLLNGIVIQKLEFERHRLFSGSC
ncbi:hypothetical protein COCNU_04G008790 [Cocos nucifera]|uniref:BRCT domain-containing protein n=1 Tax=Cocos nucifera TaxID=13894 RepID=A0A8K0I5X3_COCNU|nr:hypothetical protein COCNU_04G008790 [Cocos nucifera]